MKKILPINEQPDFREVHTSAYMLSILKTSNAFSNKWLLKNCIPIFFAEKFSHTISYAYHPLWFLKFFNSRISFYYYRKDIIGKIKKYIDAKYYVILCVNERYIPYRDAYNNKDFYHDILIYGYDDSDRMFYTIAYDDTGKYCSHEYSFNQIEMAHRTHPDRFYKFYALKVNLNYNFDCFSVKELAKRINRYLKPLRNNKGINAYKSFRKELIEAYELNYDDVDIRGFRLMMERTEALKLMSKYFTIDCSIQDDINALSQLTKSLFYLALKFNVTQNKEVLSSLIENYDKTVKFERDFFIKLLSSINDIREK